VSLVTVKNTFRIKLQYLECAFYLVSENVVHISKYEVPVYSQIMATYISLNMLE